MGHENQIQRGDLLQRLLRGLEVKGQRAAALSLESTVVPIVVLEDLTKDLEQDPRAPTWFYSQRAAALAGELSCVGIINAGPDVCLVEHVTISAGAALDFDVFTSTETAILVATAFSENASWGDTRFAAVPPLAGTVGSAVGGVAVIENMIARTRWTAGGSPTEIDGPVILAPGKGLVVQCTVAAAGFNAGFRGRVALP